MSQANETQTPRIVAELQSLLDNHHHKVNAISKYSGGWEGWLQVELVYRISNLSGFLSVNREVQYQGTNQKWDITYTTSKANVVGIELKAESINQTNQIVNQWFADTQKIAQFMAGAQQSYSIAYSIFVSTTPKSAKDARTFGEEYAGTSTIDVPQQPDIKIHYLLLGKGG